MLELSRTTFQLGHDELIRVLRSFAAVRWSDGEAPTKGREDFLKILETDVSCREGPRAVVSGGHGRSSSSTTDHRTLASRAPLSAEIAAELLFDLRRWKA